MEENSGMEDLKFHVCLAPAAIARFFLFSLLSPSPCRHFYRHLYTLHPVHFAYEYRLAPRPSDHRCRHRQNESALNVQRGASPSAQLSPRSQRRIRTARKRYNELIASARLHSEKRLGYSCETRSPLENATLPGYSFFFRIHTSVKSMNRATQHRDVFNAFVHYVTELYRNLYIF